MSPGMAYGGPGPTHPSTEDLSWLRAIPDLAVVAPADPEQTRAAVRWAATSGKPAFLRIGRFKVPAVSEATDAFVFGRADVLRRGHDLAIIATGTMVSRALDAAEDLERRGVS